MKTTKFCSITYVLLSISLKNYLDLPKSFSSLCMFGLKRLKIKNFYKSKTPRSMLFRTFMMSQMKIIFHGIAKGNYTQSKMPQWFTTSIIPIKILGFVSGQSSVSLDGWCWSLRQRLVKVNNISNALGIWCRTYILGRQLLEESMQILHV